MAYHELPLEGLCPERVEALWRFDSHRAAVHQVLPDGRMDVLARFRRLADGRLSDIRLVIAGPTQRPGLLPTGDRTSLAGVRLRSGWGGACLRLHPADLRDGVLTGDDAIAVLGPLAGPLLQAPTVEQLIERLRHAAGVLTGQAASTPMQKRTLQALDLLHRSGGQTPVAALAKAVGTSERSLRRHMHDAVGLSAKSLADILRFRRSLGLLQGELSPSLSSVALDAGYSDQAHMSRDFRKFGGFTPSSRPVVTWMHLSM